MAARVEELIGSLEERVNARTRDLKAAIDVSREITTVLELDALLPAVVRLNIFFRSRAALKATFPASLRRTTP